MTLHLDPTAILSALAIVAAPAVLIAGQMWRDRRLASSKPAGRR